jgi:hypothetical protein
MTDDVIARIHMVPWEIVRLIVERSLAESDQNCVSVLLEMVSQNDARHRVTARFDGVTNVVFNQISSNLAVVPQVVSIKDQGWEIAQYKLTDPPEECLSFLFQEADLIDSVS